MIPDIVYQIKLSYYTENSYLKCDIYLTSFICSSK